MLYLIAIGVGLVIGFLRGGRIDRLGRLPLRRLWLLPIALVIQLLIFPLFSARPLLPYATAPLHLFSYAVLLAWLATNLRLLPLGFVLLGAVANFAAVAANGGYMPASASALRAAGMEAVADRLVQGVPVANATLMSAGTRLNPLGDWLYLPKWIPFATAFSIGDVVIMIGLVWLVARGMRTDG